MIHPGMLPKKTAAPHFGVSILGKLGYDETKWAPIPAQGTFVSQSSVIGVYGEGFDEMKVKIKDKDIKTIKSYY